MTKNWWQINSWMWRVDSPHKKGKIDRGTPGTGKR